MTEVEAAVVVALPSAGGGQEAVELLADRPLEQPLCKRVDTMV